MGGGYLRYRTKFLEDLPIPHVKKLLKNFHIAPVNQILAAKQNPPPPPFAKGGNNGADTTALEKQIDEMVYALYNLTPEEIEIVEGK